MPNEMKPTQNVPANQSVAQFRVAPSVRDALNLAAQQSQSAGAEHIEMSHLLHALCEPQSKSARYLEAVGVDTKRLHALFRNAD